MASKNAALGTSPLEIKLVGETTTFSDSQYGNAGSPGATRLPDGGFAFSYAQQSIFTATYDAEAAIVSDTQYANSTFSDRQIFSNSTTLADGGYVVTWQEGYIYYPGTFNPLPQVKAQIFDQYGARIGGNILVGSKSNGPQSTPSVTALTNGSFLVTWDDGSINSSDPYGQRASIYQADGTPVRENIPMPDASSEGWTVTALSNGRFLFVGVTVESVRAQIFDQNGIALNDVFQFRSADVYTLDAAPLRDGGCVIVWSESVGTSSNYDVKAQILDSNGSQIGGEFLVNSTTVDNQLWPSVDALSNGGFAVSWVDAGQERKPNIAFQAFDRDGSRIGEEILLGTGVEPDVAGLDDGRILVSWSHINNPGAFQISVAQGQLLNLVKPGNAAPQITSLRGGDTATILALENNSLAARAKATDTDGNAIRFAIVGGVDADKFLIDSVTGALSFRNAPDFEKPGDFGKDNVYNVIVKASDGYLVDKQAISIKVVDVPKLNVTGTDKSEKLLSSTESDRIEAGKGNDVLDPGKGSDVMLGGEGNDIYYVDDAKDRVYETVTSAATDTTDAGGVDTVRSTISFALLDAKGLQFVENVQLLGGAKINATGNSLGNRLTGNDGANVLNGLKGADALVGNGGSDRLYGGNGRDTLTGGAGRDFFVFDTLPGGAANVDVITDFSRAEGDKFQFSRAVFPGFDSLGPLKAEQFHSMPGVRQAHDSSDRLIYDPVSGVLSYDPDGNGPQTIQQIAVLGRSVHPDLAYSDFAIIA